jgi:hypothetical protein
MASLKGLASIVSELRVERTNLVNQLKRVETALSVLGKSKRREFLRETGAHAVSLGSQADEPRAERAMGKESRT